MRGRSATEAFDRMVAAGVEEAEARRLAPHKAMPGNRPSSLILYDRLTPAVLGALVAMYEHKVFVESVVWRTNPFDQWGVELGKELAGTILRELEGGPSQAHDPSTAAGIRWALGSADRDAGEPV